MAPHPGCCEPRTTAVQRSFSHVSLILFGQVQQKLKQRSGVASNLEASAVMTGEPKGHFPKRRRSTKKTNRPMRNLLKAATSRERQIKALGWSDSIPSLGLEWLLQRRQRHLLAERRGENCHSHCRTQQGVPENPEAELHPVTCYQRVLSFLGRSALGLASLLCFHNSRWLPV